MKPSISYLNVPNYISFDGPAPLVTKSCRIKSRFRKSELYYLSLIRLQCLMADKMDEALREVISLKQALLE
jgi:hypothetical protein